MDTQTKKPTAMQQVWEYIFVYPHSTAVEVQKALNMKYPPNGYIAEMVKRKMLRVSDQVGTVMGAYGSQHTVRKYLAVDMPEYKLLPHPRTLRRIKKAEAAVRKAELDAKLQEVTAPKRVNIADYIQKQLTAPQDAPMPAALTEAEEFAAFLEFKALKKAMGK